MSDSYLLPTRLECRADSRADETPCAVWLDGERREVCEVVDRWYQGSQDPTAAIAEYFRLRVDDGRILVVRHDLAGHLWYIVQPFGERSD